MADPVPMTDEEFAALGESIKTNKHQLVDLFAEWSPKHEQAAALQREYLPKMQAWQKLTTEVRDQDAKFKVENERRATLPKA